MHRHKNIHLPFLYFLALLWAHPILHISTIRVNNAKVDKKFFSFNGTAENDKYLLSGKVYDFLTFTCNVFFVHKFFFFFQLTSFQAIPLERQFC